MEPLAYRSRVGRWLPAAERVSEVVASIDALIMDFDGLMIDSEYQIAMATLEILSRRGADLTMDEIGHLFGPVDNAHEWESLMQRLFAGSFTVADLDAALAVLLTPSPDIAAWHGLGADHTDAAHATTGESSRWLHRMAICAPIRGCLVQS